MLVPLFQRPYEWGTVEWEALWDDLLEQYEHGAGELAASHFTGAIVTAPARSVPVGVSKHLVIDGQQRLTTVAILFCAIRSRLPADSKDHRKLTRLLVNEDEEGLDYYKLLPTQPDRPAFERLVAGNANGDDRFARALSFFQRKLDGRDSDGEPLDIERVTATLQNRLTVVSIGLSDADDPYLIFESLNAKGAPLTQADLIRNYLLLRLPASEQQEAYETAWLPMQAPMTAEQLTEFMRQFLMMTGEEVAKSAIYAVLKKRLMGVPDAQIATHLRSMRAMSTIYCQIIGVAPHPNPEVEAALARLRRWEIAVATPFLLRLLSQSPVAVTSADALACLRLVESFAVRRAICSVPTNQLKRIFLSLAKEMPSTDVSAWLAGTLAEGTTGRRWPRDAEVQDALLRLRAYGLGDRCRFLLESIEESHAHKERVDFSGATIEHVMPQTLGAGWRAALGPDAAAVHERWLDLLGNLTLTGYNSELSNADFASKRERYAQSHFEINRWIASCAAWSEETLRERTRLLAGRICDIWPRPA